MDHSNHTLLQAGSQTAISDRMRELLARAAQDHVYEQRTQGAVLDEIRQRLEGMEWLLREVRERELGGLNGALEGVSGRLGELVSRPPAWAEGLAQHVEIVRDRVDGVGNRVAGLGDRIEAVGDRVKPIAELPGLWTDLGTVREGVAEALKRLQAVLEGTQGMPELTRRLAQLGASMEAAGGRFTRIDKALLDLTQRTERVEGGVLDLGEGLDETLSSAVQRLTGSIERLAGKVDGMTAKLAETETCLAARLEGVEGRLAPMEALDGRLESVDQRLGSVDGRLDGVDGRLAGVGDRLAGFDGRLETIAGRVDTTDGRVSDLSGRFDTVDSHVGAVEGRLETVDVRLQSIDGRIETAQSCLTGLDGRVDTAQFCLTGLDGRIETVQSCLAGVDGNLAGVKQQIADADGRLTDLAQHLTGVDGRLSKQDERLGAIDAGFEDVNERLEMVDDRVEAVNQRVGQLPALLEVGEVHKRVGELIRAQADDQGRRFDTLDERLTEAAAALPPLGELVELVRARPDRDQLSETVDQIVQPTHRDLTRRLGALEETMLALAEALLRPARSPKD
ncbi:coiled-coil domain-containing protein [Sphaerisporangium rhizosphaerae]|uniref:t-SNARE coiled-coil homology domain-containing protein n=1 Tax=Sphaerisporangium rhizosphaerae TaxID=2269375 RepID=A0ABW2P624_9ACTN